MRMHVGRATIAMVILVELGAVTGATLVWAFLTGWVLLTLGTMPANAHWGTLMWACMVGAPLGALALPLLEFSILRRTSLGRGLGFAMLGALLGLVIGALWTGGPPTLPLPAIVPALGVVGTLGGALIARGRRRSAWPCAPERSPHGAG